MSESRRRIGCVLIGGILAAGTFLLTRTTAPETLLLALGGAAAIYVLAGLVGPAQLRRVLLLGLLEEV